MRRRPHSPLAVAAVALALAPALGAGCASAPPRVSLADPTRRPPPGEYVDVLKRWTRHALMHSDFDAVLDVNATLRSPEFRAAYAEKYLQLYHVAPENQDKLRGELMSDGADTYELHLEAATHDFLMNDFTSAKTVWRLALVDDQQHEVTPVDVVATRVRREVETAFYPYAGVFSRGWRVRFPRVRNDGAPLVSSETRSLTLRISGPQGSMDLVWTLGPSP